MFLTLTTTLMGVFSFKKTFKNPKVQCTVYFINGKVHRIKVVRIVSNIQTVEQLVENRQCSAVMQINSGESVSV